eukprot:gene9576-12923_t
MGAERQIRLERDGDGQTVHIPADLALPGNEAFIRKEGQKIIIEALEQKSDLLEWLKTIEPWDEEFPDVDEGLLQNPEGLVQQKISGVGMTAISISAIVASELRFGYFKRGSDRLAGLVESMIARVAVLPYDDGASIHYAEIRRDLQLSGIPIGPVDLFIAAHA